MSLQGDGRPRVARQHETQLKQVAHETDQALCFIQAEAPGKFSWVVDIAREARQILRHLVTRGTHEARSCLSVPQSPTIDSPIRVWCETDGEAGGLVLGLIAPDQRVNLVAIVAALASLGVGLTVPVRVWRERGGRWRGRVDLPKLDDLHAELDVDVPGFEQAFNFIVKEWRPQRAAP